ncbi:UDP-N-acetylmuramate dehydrogenase [Deminuibacter soli]|uniref:UDP-N-acetylenolpyruvoylglucosamine reductase n=1 Tax=Deminuibacter soli TaxID=2291815 RepID=A0A3E1NIY1_9BACT|nr:UDP-N-acetylmuramate dehydrogenase [Deminuibacter soli]RFM27738.1 UDP-N-acetylmuramate dehydrogenase [Deminuibacter soli]
MIEYNKSLQPFNTFGMAVTAREFAVFQSAAQLAELTARGSNPLILGGGSNMLFTGNYDGLVLKNELKGIELVSEDDRYYYVKAQAGENWHQFVLHCLAQNYAGLENLSLIPGCVGASPMQNIGAYGVEIKDVFHSLEAWHLHDKTIVTFSLEDCGFGYRESVFKRRYRNQFVILNVTFKLLKKPVFHTTYGAIEQELQRMGIKDLSIQAISQAVINIRSSKLPDPAEIGNAGSFFKNPAISTVQFQQLQQQFPNMVGYPVTGNETKLAAGWLIEQCGWKGYRKGDAGCYPKQALVLVNYAHATGKEIYQLSAEIIASVQEKFGVTLEREVNII